MKILKNIKLARYTTFHIGGKAKYFAEVKNTQELKKAVDFAKNKKLKIFVLGGGSNVLLSDNGIDGLVLKIAIEGTRFEDRGDHWTVSAGAGVNWDAVVAKAVRKNLGGIENLSLIPGTVGGAVYQNIGAYGAELKNVLESVEVFDTTDGVIKTLAGKDCHLGYRDSIFQHSEGSKYVVLKATLKLKRKPILNITYPDLIKYFKNKKDISVGEIRKAVIKIRRSKLVYPTKNAGTAGSFFKNPVISVISYQLLATSYPNIRGRDTGDGLVKLSAGQLIEKAGWKGKKIKNVGVSSKHALVLVSYKNAKAEEIKELARLIQESIKDKFGVKLESEVKIMP